MRKNGGVDYSKMYEKSVLLRVLLRSYEEFFLRREDLDDDEVEERDTLFYHIQEQTDALAGAIVESWEGR